MKVLLAGLGLSLVILLPASAQTKTQAACDALSGARVISEDGKFLGNVTSPADSDSIFNRYGKGSKYDSDSIWNQYGEYGSKYASNSAMNPYSSTPPMLIKDQSVIGHLSKNKYVPGSVDPMVLGVVCFDYTPD